MADVADTANKAVGKATGGIKKVGGWVRRRVNMTNIALAGAFALACFGAAPAGVIGAKLTALPKAESLSTVFLNAASVTQTAVAHGAPVLGSKGYALGKSIFGAVKTGVLAAAGPSSPA